MCLLMVAWQTHPRYALVVAANRDEFHDRPAAPLAKWPAPAEILAGRDLRAQGTWLGIDRTRRFGVVTNFRELQQAQAGAPSRGGLIPDYLGAQRPEGPVRPGEFLAALEPRAPQYSGFNLLLSDADSLWYASNRATPFARRLPPGVYGLSNELLDTPWPKLQRVRAGFESWLHEPPSASATQLFGLLADRTPAEEPAASHTGGLPAEWARVLSAPFVLHPRYGTRSSTVVLLEPDGQLFLGEHRFDAGGRPAGETELLLSPGEWP